MLLTKPKTETEPYLARTSLQQFYSQSFLKVEDMFSNTEILEVKHLLYDLFLRFDKLPKSLTRDLSEEDYVKKSPEIERCLFLEPKLRKTLYFKCINNIAKQILGSEAYNCYDHSIIKMPKSNAPTEWHQDESYERRTEYPNLDWKPNLKSDRMRISFWLPLHDVDKDMGCMQFVPSEFLNTPLYSHHPINEGHVLTTSVPSNLLDKTVVCPLKMGGFTIHGGRTLHRTDGNTTPSHRFAWIISFQNKGRPYYNWFTHFKQTLPFNL